MTFSCQTYTIQSYKKAHSIYIYLNIYTCIITPLQHWCMVWDKRCFDFSFVLALKTFPAENIYKEFLRKPREGRLGNDWGGSQIRGGHLSDGSVRVLQSLAGLNLSANDTHNLLLDFGVLSIDVGVTNLTVLIHKKETRADVVRDRADPNVPVFLEVFWSYNFTKCYTIQVSTL